MIVLRPYQQDGVAKIRAAFAAGKRRVLYVAPTGSGKTALFTYIARGVQAKGKRVVVLVHRDELLYQTSGALTKGGVNHGILTGGSLGTPRHQVLVASVFTLIKRIEKMQAPDLLITDEAHHAATKTSWGKVALHWAKSLNLGVTATPCRLDGHGLGDIFDHMIVGPSVPELIEGGYLSPPEVYAPKRDVDLTGVHSRAGDFAIGELSKLMDKPAVTGDVIDHYRRLADGKSAVAFCCSVEHARHVAAQFAEAGYRAMSVDGGMDKEKRRAVIKALADGELQVLTSCEIISEGVDVPRIEVGIMLRPTQSMGLHLQQIGRCLRPWPGKSTAVILDHAGNSLRHGLPDQERDWQLEFTREGTPRAERTARLMVCPECYAIHAPRPHCPRCGHIYKTVGRMPQARDGVLERVQSEDVGNGYGSTLIRAARTREELEAIAAERGYRPGWVDHVMAARARKSEAKKGETVY